MKLVFISNYYNHHQKSVSEAFNKLTDGEYRFIQTEPMNADRRKLGWGEKLPPFVVESYKNNESLQLCKKIAYNADVVIIGGCGKKVEKIVHSRIRDSRLTFCYSERIYKNLINRITLPLRFIKYHIVKLNKTFLLASSAYASADYNKTGVYRNKCYKWGYFPAVKRYENIDSLIAEKTPASILWVARLIELKHPDASIFVAERLVQSGYTNFKLNIIGIGPLEEKLKAMIKEKGLEKYVALLGAMKPEEVRTHMERARIFLFTSDFNEGWGAVLNESMNSACAVVASHAIGSVPYLIENGKNGLIYKNGDVDGLFEKVRYLLDNPEKSAELGKKAYETMATTWNAELAAERFLHMAEEALKGNPIDALYTSGPCSKAEILKNSWYKK